MRTLSHRRKMTAFSGVLLGMLLGALDATIVGPAMPQIVRDLGGMQLLAWVFTAYALTSTIAVPIAGKLGDLYGRKSFHLAGISLFLAGSMLSGASGSAPISALVESLSGTPHLMGQLILFRALQGLGGGIMMANSMAIIGDLFEPRERAKYQGLVGALFGLASVLGPTLGGWLTDTYSWRWIFLINLPVGIVAMAVLFRALPPTRRGQRHAIDWWGSSALAAGLVPVLLALSWGGTRHRWTSPAILGLLGAGAALLVVFSLIERRHAEPILDLSLFRDRGFTTSVAVCLLSGVGMFGAVMFLPVFMQIVQGRTASGSGALLMPMMLSMPLASVITGQVISRTGRYKVAGVAGIGVATAGTFWLSTVTPDTSNLALALEMVCVGAGIGVTMPLFTISMQSQYPERMGQVTAAVQFFRQIGGTLGVALLGGVMNTSLRTRLSALVTGDSATLNPMLGSLAGRLDHPERLLNGSVLETISASLPPEAAPAFARFVADLKLALAGAIGSSFFYGFLIMSAAFVCMFFVPELPLLTREAARRPAGGMMTEGEAIGQAAGEAGRQLLAEEAVLPAQDEPRVTPSESERSR